MGCRRNTAAGTEREPSNPPIEVATGHADAVGEAKRSLETRAAAVAMAARMAAALLG